MSTYKLNGIVMPDGNSYDVPIFIAKYGVTTFAEIDNANNSGKAVFCIYNDNLYPLSYSSIGDGDAEFQRLNYNGDTVQYLYCTTSNTWGAGSRHTAAYPYSSTAPSNIFYLTVATTTSQIIRSTIQFGSSTNKYLSQKGTWENIPSIPANVSYFSNDAGYITSADVPTKVSELTNDSGFVDASGASLASPVQSVNGQTGAVSLTIPTVPTNVSAFTNDSGYLTLATLPIYNGGVH
ncbi:MAG: hypothetical protein IKF42_04265 [Mogibacterium sp.]|nr:hypothetical protein [Mogibacterium sp.]